MKTIFYRAQTQYENYGDLLINRNLIRMMRKHGKLVIDVNGVPDFFLKGLELREDEVSNNKLYLLRMVKEAVINYKKVYFFTKPGHVEYHNKLFGAMKLSINTIVYFFMWTLGIKICRFGGTKFTIQKVCMV